MKVLDSDFLIAVLRKDPDVEAKVKELIASDEAMATTIFNAQEVLYGSLLSQNHQNYSITMRLLDATNVLDYNMESVHHMLEIKLLLEKKGEKIGIFDELIAGICLANGASIVTRNVDHFKRVPGLEVETW